VNRLLPGKKRLRNDFTWQKNSIGARHEEIESTQSPVGAGLPAIAVFHPTSTLDGWPHRWQASSYRWGVRVFAHKKSAAILAALFFYQSVVFSSYPSITSHNASSSASLNKPAG
jgi:hypothetical protein